MVCHYGSRIRQWRLLILIRVHLWKNLRSHSTASERALAFESTRRAARWQGGKPQNAPKAVSLEMLFQSPCTKTTFCSVWRTRELAAKPRLRSCFLHRWATGRQCAKLENATEAVSLETLFQFLCTETTSAASGEHANRPRDIVAVSGISQTYKHVSSRV
jgi:hypothetical protein